MVLGLTEKDFTLLSVIYGDQKYVTHLTETTN